MADKRKRTANAAHVDELVQRLAETEAALQATLGHEADSVVDPATGTPILLRQAQQELLQRDARQRLLLEQLPAVVWTTDTELRYTSLMGAGLAALGLQPGQLVGTTAYDQAPGEGDATGYIAAHERALKGDHVSLDVDWKGRAFQVHVEPLSDAKGIVVGCVGVALDITERKQAEEALRQSYDELEREEQERTQDLWKLGEQLRVQNEDLQGSRETLEAERWRYQVLFESAPDCYLTTTPEGIIRQVNRAAAMLLNAQPDTLVGRPLLAFAARASNHAFSTLLGRPRSQSVARTMAFEACVAPRHGAEFDAAVTVAPERDANGDICGLLWMIRDTTREKQAQEALQMSEEKFRSVIEQSLEGFALTDEEGQIIEWNAAEEKIVGLKREEVLRRPIWEVQFSVAPSDQRTPGNLERVRASTQELLATGSAPFACRYLDQELQRPDGTRITMRSVTFPIRTAKGYMLAGICRDVTREKWIEEEREELLAEANDQRRRAETLSDAVEVERDLLQTIMENTRTQLAYLDRDLNFVRVNSAYAEGSGHAANELIGRNHFELFPYGENEEIFRRAVETGEPVEFRAKPFEYADQPWRGVTYWDWTLVPVKDAKGEVQGLVFSLADVTENVRTQKQIEETAARDEAILDGMLDGLIAFDLSGNVVDMNATARRMYGFASPEEARTTLADLQGAFELRSLEGRKLRRKQWPMPRVLAGETLEGFEARVRRLSDGAMWINHYGGTLVYGTDGKPFMGVLSMRDVTAQKEAERERERLLAENREQREFLERLLETAQVGIAVVGGPKHRFSYANRQFEAIPGGSDGSVVGRTITEVFPKVVAEGQNEMVNTVHATGQTLSAREYEASLGPGREHTYWDIEYAPLRGAEGGIESVLVMAHEVTHEVVTRKRIEEWAARDEAILSSMAEGLIIFDLQGNVLSMNPAALRMHGFEGIEEARKHLAQFANIFEVTDPDGQSLPTDDWPLARVLRGEDVERLELKVRPIGGDAFWYGTYTGTLVRDASGTPMFGILTLRDITARKQADEDLRQYSERLKRLHEIDQAILAAHPSAEVVADIALKNVVQLVPCVRAGVMMMDMEKGEQWLLASTASGESALPTGWRGPIERTRSLDALMRGEIGRVEEVGGVVDDTEVARRARSDGVRSAVLVPLLAHGRLIGAISVGMATAAPLDPGLEDFLREVADELAIAIEQARLYEQVQRHADELEQIVAERSAELYASEARLRAIFENSAVGIMLVDLEGKVLAASPALERFLGYTSQELRGMHFSDFTAPESRAPDETKHAELVQGDLEQYSLEKKYVRKDGGIEWGTVTASLIRQAGGKPRYVIRMIEDTTERKQAAEALLQAEKLAVTGKMAASVAHEINNPLQSVIGCLGLAQEILAEGGDADRYLQVSLEELRRTSRTIGRLRDLSRKPSAEDRKPTDVNALLDQMVTLNGERCRDRNVELVYEPAAALPLVTVAPDQVGQAFLNLLLNAIEAMPDGGRLEIRTEATTDPAGVLIAFSDTGGGISPEVLPRLFQPFVSSKSEGLGLGLYILNNTVKEYGGRVDVQSEVGKGTTFTIWLRA